MLLAFELELSSLYCTVTVTITPPPAKKNVLASPAPATGAFEIEKFTSATMKSLAIVTLPRRKLYLYHYIIRIKKLMGLRWTVNLNMVVGGVKD